MKNTSGDSRSKSVNMRRRAVKVLFRDAVVLGCCLVLVELCLQWRAPEYAQHLFDAEFTGWHPVQVNEQGFRGVTVPREKRDDEMRILAIGDSVTFGTAVAAHDAWPMQLASVIGEKRSGTVSAVNAAVPAMDLRQMRLCFEEDWADYSPDVVVLALTGNIVSLGWIRRDEQVQPPENGYIGCDDELSALDAVKTKVRRAVKRLALPAFLSFNSQRVLYHIGLLSHQVDSDAPYGVLLAHGWRQRELSPSVAEQAWRILAADLAALRDVVHDAGAKLVVTYSPPRFVLSDSWSDNEKAMPLHRLTIDPCARAASTCAELGIRYVNAQDTLRGRRAGVNEPLYVQFDYTHLSPLGHRIVADAFAQELSRTLVTVSQSQP